MRILHCITSLQQAAGTSVFCGELCDALNAEGEAVTVAVCDPHATACYTFRQDVKIMAISMLFDSPIKHLFPYDIVHIHGLWSPILHRIFRMAQRHPCKVVWSPHGMLAPWAMKHKWWKKWLPWLLYQKRDLQNVDLFHATSELEKAWLHTYGFNKPICVVPLGTHVPKQTREEKEHAHRHTLLFVGRIYPVKNLDTLIRAFAKMQRCQRSSASSATQRWQLVLVGPDQAGHQAELIRLAHALELRVFVSDAKSQQQAPCDWRQQEDDFDIFFLGARFGAGKAEIYACADLFVLPSHTENFGGVVIDALAAGVPVIASNKTPFDWVEEKKCGVWCSNDETGLYNALQTLTGLSDQERKEMGLRGRQIVAEEFAWDALASRMKKAYTGLFAMQSTPAHSICGTSRKSMELQDGT